MYYIGTFLKHNSSAMWLPLLRAPAILSPEVVFFTIYHLTSLIGPDTLIVQAQNPHFEVRRFFWYNSIFFAVLISVTVVDSEFGGCHFMNSSSKAVFNPFRQFGRNF
jgi:hypothetical protein